MVNDWHPEKIKAEVRLRGVSLYQLDAKAKLPRKTCSRTLYQPHAKAERAIAQAIGVSPAIIWPSRYDARGRRLYPQPAQNLIWKSWRGRAS